MRLALLSGANPKTCNRGPAVRLQAGTWRLDCDGIVDSKLFLTIVSMDDEIFPSIEVMNGKQFEITRSRLVQLGFKLRGSEKYISIVTEKVA